MRGPLGQGTDPVARLGSLDRGQDPSELLVPARRVTGQAVVALGELRQRVVADDRDRLAHVTGRHPRDRGRDLAQRGDEVEPDDGTAQDADGDDDREDEQQHACADLRIDRPGQNEEGTEDGERDERGRDQGQRQTRLEWEDRPALGIGLERCGHASPVAGSAGTTVATNR